MVEEAAKFGIEEAFKSGPIIGTFVMCFIIIALLIGIILYKEIRKMKQDFKNSSELVKKEIWAEVEIIRGEQRVLSSQLTEVKENIHKVNSSLQRFDHRISSMDRTMLSMHTTLKFMALQMGGDLNEAIKESIKSQEDNL